MSQFALSTWMAANNHEDQIFFVGVGAKLAWSYKFKEKKLPVYVTDNLMNP